MPVHSLFIMLLIPIMVGLFIKVCSDVEQQELERRETDTEAPSPLQEAQTTVPDDETLPRIRSTRVIPKYKRRELYGDFPSPPPYSHGGAPPEAVKCSKGELESNYYWLQPSTCLNSKLNEALTPSPPTYRELINTV